MIWKEGIMGVVVGDALGCRSSLKPAKRSRSIP